MKTSYFIKFFCLIFFVLLTSVGFGQSEQEAATLVEGEEYEAALEMYSTLKTNFLQQKNYVDYLRISIKEGVLQQDIGGYQEAKKSLNITLIEVKDYLPIDTTVALVYHKLGVSHYYLEEYEKAIQNWEKAIQIRINYLPPNHNYIAKGYKNIGSAQEKLNNFQVAEKSYKKSIDLLLSNSKRDLSLLADDYREMGYISSIKNDIDVAKTYYSSAQKLYEEIYVEEPWNLGVLYSDLSSLFLDIEDYQKVIEYGEKTIDIYSKIEDKYEEDYWAVADAYNNIGTAYLSLGEKSKKVSDIIKATRPLQQAILITDITHPLKFGKVQKKRMWFYLCKKVSKDEI